MFLVGSQKTQQKKLRAARARGRERVDGSYLLNFFETLEGRIYITINYRMPEENRQRMHRAKGKLERTINRIGFLESLTGKGRCDKKERKKRGGGEGGLLSGKRSLGLGIA